MLESLGFRVMTGSAGNHYVVYHDHLPDFMARGYACRHGRNGYVKPGYARAMAGLIQAHQNELTELLEGKTNANR